MVHKSVKWIVNGSGLLGVLLVVLRFAGVIDWSWWVTTSPIWGGAVFGLGSIFGGVLVWFLAAMWDGDAE